MKTVVFIRGSNIYSDSRATKEILALQEAGYHVVVLGWDRNGRAKHNVKMQFASNVEFRFFSLALKNGIIGKRADFLLRWIFWVYKNLTEIKNISIVHACDLDAGIGAYLYCKKAHTALVYDIYDYYVDSHSVPLHIRNFIENIEIKIIEFSKVTIICTEERREQIKKARAQKVIVIHNSPEVEQVNTVDLVYDYVYCGSLANNRLLQEILEEYKNYSNLRVAFAGDGVFKTMVEDCAEMYANFEYLGEISYDQVLSVESRARALSAIYEPSMRNHQLCAPNKFYEALALGKPVIVCRGTGIDKIVEKENIGRVIDYSAKAFYESIEDIKESDTDSKRMGKNARSLYGRKYNWKLMKTEMLKAYGSIESKK